MTVISPADPSVSTYEQVNVLPTFGHLVLRAVDRVDLTEPGPSIVDLTFFSTDAVSTVVAPHAATRTPDARASPRPAAFVMFMDAG